jgi:surfactin synthase thioesterase subunit
VLCRFHPSRAARRRLVCFPHAGGSAIFCFPVSAELRDTVDLLAVQYPGRQDRRGERAAEDLHLMADEVAGALGRWHDLPLPLFGHSTGALVAFEVARRIERAGGRVDHLSCPAAGALPRTGRSRRTRLTTRGSWPRSGP